jgi:hypothetical protein
VASPNPLSDQEADQVAGIGLRLALHRLRQPAEDARPDVAAQLGFRESTALKGLADSRIVSQLTAARTVAERRAPDDSSAISPT